MTTYIINEGSSVLATNVIINGIGGQGYLMYTGQGFVPNAPTSGNLTVYSDSSSRFSILNPAGNIGSIDTTSITANRVWTMPDITDTIVSSSSTNTLANKTISSVSNPVVDANQLITFPITGSFSNGDVLKYNSTGSHWGPLTLSGTTPINYSNGAISVAVGTVANTVAAGNDLRFSSVQLIIVKATGAGYGEFSSISSAVSSITDASSSMPYQVDVYPGIYYEPNIIISPYITIAGSGAGNSTVVIPTSASITQFTMSSNSGLNNLIMMGLGTPGIGISVPSSFNTFINNVRLTNFDTLISLSAATGPTQAIIYDCAFSAPYSYGIVLDGTTLSSANECSLSLNNMIITADTSVISPLVFKGPFAGLFASTLQVVGANSGDGMQISDGAFITVQNCIFAEWNNGINVINIGAGPNVNITAVSLFASVTDDLVIAHPATTGVFDGIAARDKININASSPITLSFVDSVNSAFVSVGSIVYSPVIGGQFTEIDQQTSYCSELGAYNGGVITAGTGLNANVSAGNGYIATGSFPDHQLINTTWIATSVSLTASTSNYIYVDISNVVQVALSLPSPYTTTILGRVQTTSSGIEFIDLQYYTAYHPFEAHRQMTRDVFKVLYANGSMVTANGSRQLAISSGQYYYLDNQYNPSGQVSPATWWAYYHSSGVFTRSQQTIVDNAQYDNGTDLTAIGASLYVKHSLYIIGDGHNEQYFLVYGQMTFSDLNSAKNGVMPTPPSYFDEGVALIAAIIVQQGNASVQDIINQTPTLSGTGASFTGITVHGQLSGLLADDHPQYLLVNGTRAMSGDLNMSSNNIIIPTGTVNGVLIATHASRHLPNGADPLTTAAPLVNLSVSSTNAIGTANSFARSDHSHFIDITGFNRNNLTGTLTVANGGTGAATLTSGNFLQGNGTSAISALKAVPSGVVVGTTDSQTLTNKMLSDSTTFIVDNIDATKQLTFSIGGATTGTILTIAAVQTANRTLTLPDATDTLIGRATTDSLTNKTITDGSNTVYANGLQTTSSTVIVIGSSAPSVGYVLTATGSSTATWQAQGSSLIDNTTFILHAADNTIRLGFSCLGTTGTMTTLITSQTANRSLTLPNVTDTLVARTTTDTLTNKTLTAPVISTIVNTGTLTLPTSTDTLVGRATTDSLTNKSLVDASVNWVNSTTSSKKVSWSIGGASSNTTLTLAAVQTANHTITFPNATDTLIAAATAATLTNKTITSTSNTVYANGLQTTSSAVIVSGSVAPSAGQALIATNATTASWSAPGAALVDNVTFIVHAADNTIRLGFSITGTTGTTTTFTTAQTANRTLTFPDATDMLVGRATTDSLTNKSLVDASVNWVDNLDATKKVNWTIGGSTTGTTLTLAAVQTANRTLTFPDATDTLTAQNTVDTLTNKTITDSSNTVYANGIQTTGAAVIVSGSAPPIAGQVLIASSPTAASWQTQGSSLIDNTTFILHAADNTIRLGFSCLGTTGTTTTLATSQTANRTLTLPDVTDTIVARTTTDVLTNKTLTAPVISTIVNTGTLTLPTSTDTLIGRATTDSLTNKSLIDASNNWVNTADNTKKVGWSIGGATTSTKLTLTAAQTANRTLTLPDATDTIVARNTTDVLTNKSLTDNSVNWVNTADNTKKVSWSIGGATTGTTTTIAASQTANRTLTLPDVTDTIVARTTVDTLTNKTLTAPIIATIVNTGTLTLPTSTDTLIARNTTDSLTNKTITSASNTVYANGLQTTSSAVIVSGSVAPSAGQVLTATSSSTATWQAQGSSLIDNVTFILHAADNTIRLGFSCLGTTGTTTTLVTSQTANRSLTLPDITDTIVTRTNTETLTNKTLTAPVIATIVNTGTLTLPTSTDTLIGRATTDLLSNKSLVDSSVNFVNVADNTKKIAHSIGGATTGTTMTIAAVQTANRTLTLPDATDTIVARNTVDTLTNKTLTAPVISTIVNTGTLTLPTSTDTLIGRATTDSLSNKSLIDNSVSFVNVSDATKKVSLSIGGATTGTVLTLAAIQTANRTLTLPDATDTIVCRSTTDNLSNKSLIDASVNFVNTSDNTKKVNFSISGASTGTILTLSALQTANRTLTLPDATDTIVARNTADTLTNKTLTAPVIATIVNTGTLTLPTSTDTLIGRATTDSLTNKSLVDNSVNFVNVSDATKKVGFSIGGATTGTTMTIAAVQTVNRTVTLPDASDTLIGRATVDTLTNKTLTAPVISTIVNTGTLTLPTSTDTLIGRATSDTLTNKTITSNTNTVYAGGIQTSGAAVVISTTAPSTGQVLTATSATTAAWQAQGNNLIDNTTFILHAADNTIRLGFSCLGTTGTTTTLVTSQTANRSLTLPDITDTIVTRTNTETLTNKTLTSPVIGTIVNTGTLTLPTSTDTLVGRATTDSLTNKSFVDSSDNWVNVSDATKKVGWSIGGATTSTKLTLTAAQTANRTLTFPDATDTLVARTTTDVLTNKTLTAPVIATIVNTGTLTLPTSTDTLVGRATTDSLSNKSLIDNSVSFVNVSDTTKKITHSIGSATTGTTMTIAAAQTVNRTLTLPDATDTLIARATTDTLTNKTITASSNTVYANGLQTTGSAVVVSAASAPSSGQVLTATSATTAVWQSPSAGGTSSNWTVQDILSTGTNGGTMTANTWNVRPLNTLVGAGANVTLATNTITFAAGTYVIHAMAPGYHCALHKTKLVNTGTSTDLIYGSSANSANNSGCTAVSVIDAILTFGSSTNVQLQHWCSRTENSDGMGIATGINGITETYASITITQIA